jgi:putative transposase
MKSLRLKVKSEAWPWLDAAAFEVNQVWNFANATSMAAAARTDKLRKWLTGFDLCQLTAGATDCFERIRSATIQSVCVQYAQKRRVAKRLKLRWRVSGGARRSLGWVPFKAVSIKRKGNSLRFAGKTFRVFEAALLDGIKLRDGQFSQDALGQWWFCLPVETPQETNVAPRELVGIDLGLKATATTSDGDTLEAGRFYRDSEQKIASAQRRGHKRQAKRLNLKAKNRRSDALHKFSTRIVQQYQNIRIGDVSSSKLVKTRMAKSVLDAGWYMLKTQLTYKGQRAGRSVEVVDEAYTTRACSNCGQLTGPKGLRQLVVRQWSCECGVTHDRDVNAARNIARSRLAPPSAGTNRKVAIWGPASDAEGLTTRRARNKV